MFTMYVRSTIIMSGTELFWSDLERLFSPWCSSWILMCSLRHTWYYVCAVCVLKWWWNTLWMIWFKRNCNYGELIIIMCFVDFRALLDRKATKETRWLHMLSCFSLPLCVPCSCRREYFCYIPLFVPDIFRMSILWSLAVVYISCHSKLSITRSCLYPPKYFH